MTSLSVSYFLFLLLLLTREISQHHISLGRSTLSPSPPFLSPPFPFLSFLVLFFFLFFYPICPRDLWRTNSFWGLDGEIEDLLGPFDIEAHFQSCANRAIYIKDGITRGSVVCGGARRKMLIARMMDYKDTDSVVMLWIPPLVWPPLSPMWKKEEKKKGKSANLRKQSSSTWKKEKEMRRSFFSS